ncbi:MAG: permease, partial [Planctomycetota bacterium]|nr:permease [Planctomycetota bacterium]
RKAAWLVLTLLALATACGAFAGHEILEGASASWVAFLQSLIAGALLHVVLGHSMVAVSGNGGAPSAMGGLLALGLLGLLSSFEVPGGEHALLPGFWDTFLSLTSQSAPALLAASATIMLTKAFVPGSMMRLFHGRNSVDQALRGTVAGLPVPICSCGVVPVYRGLVEAGSPPPASLAFLVAAPEVGWAAILLSIGLLGSELTIARVGSAAILALVVGVVVGKFVQPTSKVQEEVQPPRPPLGDRIREGFQYGFKTIVDDTAPWILAGLLLAAAVEPVLQTGWLANLPVGLDILLATLIGLPLYVCASGSTPLVAILLAKGLSPGAGIAFLLTGPATNLTTAGLLSSLHGKKVAVIFGITMVLMAVAVGFGVNAVLGTDANPVAADAIHRHPDTSNIVFVGLLALVYLASLFRQGVLGFIGKVIRPHAEETGTMETSPEQPATCCSSKSSS